jgi:uncharacterized protein YfdQ (DUF2303 family)
MTDTIFDGKAIEQIAHLARLASDPTPVDGHPGLYIVATSNGNVTKLDLRPELEADQAGPWRARGRQVVNDATSFLGYFQRHAIDQSEVWADPARMKLTAVLDPHLGSTELDADVAGWREHRVELALVRTQAWTDWLARNRQHLTQVDFAEHIEDHLADITNPAAADMLELAQSLTINRQVNFESGKRLKTGETALHYRETDTNGAAAGGKGDIGIPDDFEVTVQPFEGGGRVKVTARFRYRILPGGGLTLGYVLDRVEDVERAAFDNLLDAVRAGIDQPVWLGTP